MKTLKMIIDNKEIKTIKVKNQDNETPIIFTSYEIEKLEKMEHER